MAVVLDVFATTLTRQVFVKPPDAVRQFTPLPRAIANFTVVDGTVSVKPVNDQQEMQITIVLDPQFAYRMIGVSINCTQDVANDWRTQPYFQVQNVIRGLPVGAEQRHVFFMDDSFAVPLAREMWICRDGGNLPSYMMQHWLAISTINFFATNQTAAAGAEGEVNALFEFLEYDIEQAQYYALHYPTLTLDR